MSGQNRHFDHIVQEHGIRILDSIFDGILIVDADSRVVYVNPEYLRIVQISEAEILGKPLQEVRPGAILPQVVKTGRSVEGAYRREGSVEYVVDMSPIIDGETIVGGISVVKDITEVQRLSKELVRFQRSNKQLRSSIRRINAARYTFSDIVYASPSMERVVAQAKAMAHSAADILITGESGTGKEVFAQAIHNASARSRGPFLALNCATLAPNVIESELFGYADGAFTGAKRGGKAGFFEVADGGTLFLDEVTELTVGAQAKLLRVLQERTVRRVGETSEIPMDVRVITASNRNIPELIDQNLFRNDLYYRLNTLHLDLPPLRERGGDVVPLAEFFFGRASGRNDTRTGSGTNLGSGVAEALLAYAWPGNIRELRNVMEFAAHMGARDRVETVHLPGHLFICPTRPSDGMSGSEPDLELTLAEVAAAAEKSAILAKLKQHGRSLPAKRVAARELGISLTTLYAKMARYGIN